jgi:predicted AlkP superfamily phosphohydrolase/phosphomutase
MPPTAKRVLVIGLDCATPQLVFDRFAGDLENLKALLSRSHWGTLESVIPAITVPAWACGMTSRDPGQLGIYGFRNRKDHSYDGLSMATSNAVREDAVWDVIARKGKQSIVLAVPPAYPPKPINGSMVGCFLTPDTKSDYTHPPELRDEIAATVGEYSVDVEDFRTDDKDRILRQIDDMTRRRFQLFRHLIKTRPWDLAMMVEIGVDRIHHGFWQYMDEQHHRFEPGNPYQHAIRDYYRLVDQEVGATLREIDDETAVIIMSDHGAKLMRGGIRINEWLRNAGYLTLKTGPVEATRFEIGDVDWSRTRVWGEGGYYGRVFLNVRGREPEGIVPQEQYESLRDELATKLVAINDESGKPLGTRVFKPEQIYREVRNVAPDLIVYFGDLDWRSVATVGGSSIHTYENDTRPHDANHAQHGIVVVKAPGMDVGAEIDGAKLVDTGPTILSLLGQPVPSEMIGRPLL